MSIQEIRGRIYPLVDESDDEALLEEVNWMLSGELKTDTDALTDEHLAKIEEAREAVRQGNYVSLAEHKRKIDQWLAARK